MAEEKKTLNDSLIEAAQNGWREVARQTLRDGADPNVCDANGVPVLILAIEGRFAGTAFTIIEHPKTNVNLQGPDGNTAFMIAMKYQDFGIAGALRRRGAMLDFTNGEGKTGYDLARAAGFAIDQETPNAQGTQVSHPYRRGYVNRPRHKGQHPFRPR